MPFDQFVSMMAGTAAGVVISDRFQNHKLLTTAVGLILVVIAQDVLMHEPVGLPRHRSWAVDDLYWLSATMGGFQLIHNAAAIYKRFSERRMLRTTGLTALPNRK
jgi:hypothetical protein